MSKSESFGKEAIWGAVRVREPEEGVIVFEEASFPAPEIKPDEPRNAAEAFTLWLVKQGGSVRIRTVRPDVNDCQLRAVAVRFERRPHAQSGTLAAGSNNGPSTYSYEIDSENPRRLDGVGSRVTTYVFDVNDTLV